MHIGMTLFDTHGKQWTIAAITPNDVTITAEGCEKKISPNAVGRTFHPRRLPK